MSSIIASLGARRVGIEALPRTLTALGIEVPAEIIEANKRSVWKTVDPSVAVEAARLRLESAETERDWESAEQEFASALAIGQVRSLDDYKGTIAGIHNARIEGALTASIDPLIGTLCAEYNKCVPEFTSAVEGIPSLGRPDFQVFDLTPEDTTNMQTAKKNADRMTAVWDVYRSVASIGGFQSSAGYETSAARLGDFESARQLYSAAEYSQVYATNGHVVTPTLRPLAPHVAIVLAGGSLNLKHPTEADAEWDRLTGKGSGGPAELLPVYSGAGA